MLITFTLLLPTHLFDLPTYGYCLPHLPTPPLRHNALSLTALNGWNGASHRTFYHLPDIIITQA